MINKVILVGNLGRDPEIRHLEGGSMVTRFSVATNENRRDKDGQWQQYTEWHDVTAWGALAERAAQQLHKGTLVYIEGKITHRKWQDREGRDRYSTDVVANTIRNLERRDSQRTGSESEEMSQEDNSGQEGDASDGLPF
jgi:single-strand DNA-binding protein